MARTVETTVVQFLYTACPDFDFSMLIGDAGLAVFGPLASQADCHTEWTGDNTAMIDRDGIRIIVSMSEPALADDRFAFTVAVGPADTDHAPRALLQAAAGLCQTIADAVANQCPADQTEWYWLPRVLTPACIDALFTRDAPAIVRPARIRAGQSRHQRPDKIRGDQRHIRPEHPAVIIARSARRTRPARPSADHSMRLAIKATRQALYPAEPPAPQHHARLSAHLLAITGTFMSFSNTAFAQQVLGLF
jgi:hypothetical protein